MTTNPIYTPENNQIEAPVQKIYEVDYYQWLNITAQQLRDRQFDHVDLDNLIEEIEAMSGSQLRELKSRLIVLLMHLLKYQYQPSKRSKSWLNTIVEQRSEIELLLEQSPSLTHKSIEVFDQCYLKARRNAAKETKLSVEAFPALSPFTLDDTLNPDWLPE